VNASTPPEVVEALRTTLKERDRLRRENLRLRAGASEPIAIVGMACRYPGGVSSPEELWRLVAAGRDAISEFPSDRGWDLERLYNPDPDNFGTSYAREGGFLADAGDFDPGFFAISPREAEVMDPQERLLLESCWEALEDAGIDPASLKKTQTGVFAGVGERAYAAAPGMTSSIVSGRVSYALGLEGPAISIDTACSSSLVALHLASQALRQGECTLALAGGVTVLSSPGPFIAFSIQRGLAPDGRCKSFAEAADGVAWGEGVGMLVLERLSDANRHGHRVLALLRGSAVNQDGASNGLTAPNGPSQERVIRQALANAGITTRDVDVVEAHGTGTTLGDPIEAGALLATYGQERERPLKLGSVKSNIGHTQAASGVAGVIKMALAMREGVLPKTLHVDAPSSKVDWEAGEIELLSEQAPWEANGAPRRAGISSFGVSGTNAHVILEQAPAAEPVAPTEPLKGPVPLFLSAKTEPALAQAAERLATHLAENPELDLTDLAFSLATTRSAFEHRAVALGGDRDELLAALANPIAARARDGKLAHLFTGQGSQRLGMGKELYESDPNFAGAFDAVCAELDQHLQTPLEEIVFAKGKKAAALLEDTAYAQPALFAIEVALHEALVKRGLRPDLLAGHSIGEIAAAHISGVFELPDAAKLVAARGRLMGALPAGGAMAAIEATEAEAAESIAGKEQVLAIAAINGPTSTVISGAEEAVEAVRAHWEERGRKAKRLAVSHAFHSPLIEPMLAELAEVAKSLTYNEPKIPIVSNLSGELLDADQATDPAYWVRHAREPVRFADAVATLKAQGASTYVELGPDPVLCAMARESLGDDDQVAFVPTLRESRAEAGVVTTTLAQTHAAGAKVDWNVFFEGTGAKRVPLPTYPFQRKRYWFASTASGADASAIGQSNPGHPLLAAAIEGPSDGGLTLTGRLSLATHPWLADHVVAGTVLLPGTAFLELALRAGEEARAQSLEELILEAPLVLREGGAVAIQVSVSALGEDGRREIAIHSRPEGKDGDLGDSPVWTRHAQGALSEAPLPGPEPLAVWPPKGAAPIEVDYLYDRLAEAGLEYGPAFQGLDAAWAEGQSIYLEVALPEEQAIEAERFLIHPALLDSALQGIALSTAGESQAAMLPFSWGGVSLQAVGARQLRARISAEGEGRASLVLTDGAGAPVATVGSLTLRPLGPEQRQAPTHVADGLMEIDWIEAPLSGRDAPPAEVEVLGCETKDDARTAEVALRATQKALAAVQDWLADDSKLDSRLALMTEGAVAVDGEAPDPAAATIWGLIRSAQSEHPGRFALIDSDGSEASVQALPAALAQGVAEPQLALREGVALVPRLARTNTAEAKGDEKETPTFDPERTVLVTGATGGLGALIARHLAEHHGIRHLLLASRSGPEAKGATDLQAELEAIGAEVRIAACDLADRQALESLLAGVPTEHPLGAVIHCAGTLADGTIEAMAPEQVDRVFAPKVDAAWNLHELTAGLDLAEFLMFSSIAGVLGGPGQANYAAANVFLDALAQRRRAEGLPGTSVAWGLWERGGGMASTLGEADIARMRRGGIEALSDERGLALFDAALGGDCAATVAVPLNHAGLRGLASVDALPPIFSGLVRMPRRRSAAAGSLAVTLANLAADEAESLVLDLVRGEVAAVLGHASSQEIEPDRAFQELGFDSLSAVELRNRLGAIAGLRLSATVVFDYPSSAALAEHLLSEASASGAAKQVAVRAQASEEPIAIVGMACRYPGGVRSPAELWQLVAEGRDGISEFPADRGWDVESLYNPDPDNPGTSYTREGGFLAEAGEFDAEFFSISPREALGTDPQQRLLLESCWEALEDAGIDPGSLRKTQTGVFAGVMYQDYGPAPGMTQSIVSGRVAYTLGLEGPAITVDTACSSSLVAMHLASQALRQGECSLALAGGVTALATPTVFMEFSRQRGLAPDGRSKSFAEAADGVGWGEGVGTLVLERLSDAERNGHPVLALLKGSAVNQDGASNGLTAPNGPSQERVIRQALANARLEPRDVDAVEAHGTGTTLGDPIEAGALLATYGQDREEPLKLGSIKSNIGHTQAAAGVAGVIKMTQAMRAGVLPKTLHVDAPSSKVDWEAGEIELLSERAPWESNGRPRRAGVSSFGISGTNAHVILEEAPGAAPTTSESSEDGGQGDAATSLPTPILLPLSAKAEPALTEVAQRLATHLQANPDLDPSDVAYSLATTRAAFEHRAVVLGSDREELLASLTSLADGKESRGLARGHARAAHKPVFLFPGQGAQMAGMGLGLIESSPTFAEQMAACEEALAPHVDWSLAEVLREEDASWLDRLDIVQPALFAVMVSLAKLWRQCGVEPAAVVGHSQGEIAAAHVAGALSLEDAALIVANRGKAMAEIAGKGGMLSVSLALEQLTPYTEHLGERVSLAAINGPASLVLSGDPGALEEIQGACEVEGVRAQRIAVDYAAHSAQIEALKDELLEAFAPISPQSAEIALHSTVTGEQIDTEELGPEYWYRNLRETVLLEPALRSLLDMGRRAFVEIGPHPVLSFGVAETIEAALADPSEAILLSSLRRDEDATRRFALSLAEAHANGIALDWPAFFKGSKAKRVPLPTYPFQHRHYWLPSAAASADAGAIGLSAAEHPFLGAAIEDPTGEGIALSGRISLATHPWLADHAVAGNVLLPGTAFLELALRAAEEVGAESVEELTLQAPLVISGEGAVQLRVLVGDRGEADGREVSIHSRPAGEDGEWVQHAGGFLSDAPAQAQEPIDAWPPKGAAPLEVDYLYDRLAEVGLEYGPAFQGLTAAWRDGERIYAEVSLPEESAHEAQRFAIHPALLDSALHAIGLTREGSGVAELPFSWGAVSLQAVGAASLRVCLESGEETVALRIADGEGAPLATVGSLALRRLEPAQLQAAGQKPEGLLGLAWTELPLVEPETAPPEVECLHCEADGDAPTGEAARKATQATLEAVQRWLADEARSESRLALITRGAVAVGDGAAPDPAAAAIWGLIRSAQSEHPGRFALIDDDGSETSEAALAAALATGAVEPQIALRDGAAFVPRVVRLEASEAGEGTTAEVDPERTVLITGATGGLGALVARHLVERHGARRLLLVSRSGLEAEGAAELQAELGQLGAEVRIAACDISDREALERLLASVADEHPLGAVIHCAGALADGTVETLTPEQIDRVFAPKAAAAWSLHELTRNLDLSAFMLFSSAAGTLGGPGQANYAAANVFLDSLAELRRSEGLPAISVAWGLWEDSSGMTAQLGEADLARMRRGGIEALSSEQGLSLFDAALDADRATALALPLNVAGLRGLASAGALPPIFRGLVRVPKRRSAQVGSLAARFAALPKAEHEGFSLELVRSEVALVLGHASAAEVEPERAFKELGFDSLAAVELRNRLSAVAGLRLPATVVFDHPNAAALAKHLLAEATAGGAARQVAVRTQASEEPIAILGMACRYPGGVSSPQGLWQLVAEGGDAIAEFPADRGWDIERLYDPDPDSPGTSYAREGGFLADAGEFDTEFFGISPREALVTDPQQRLLLESCWEALEDAGIDPASLRQTQTGVFAGVMYQDYGPAAGGTSSIVSGRVAYTLGLEGPAISVDTACSSSLVAMHLASQALQQGECTLALAGGVTTLATPGVFVEFSRQRGLAPDGRSKSFAEAADGAGFSEGVGVLALERLSDAQRNGHPVLALLKGSAVNQDGASNGLTAPNGPSQERVIRQALANARLEPKDVDAVEAHGTGTTLGDPIEAGALLATYGQDREEPLKLGSIKSNIGHTQAAAGVAGVIKMTLAMREGVLPKTLHVDAPSSKVDWEAGEIELLSEESPWEGNGAPRRAGISSFGISGTNAHVILEEAPEVEAVAPTDPLQGPVPLVLSAKTEPALAEAAQRLTAHLTESPELDLTDLAFSLATTRSAFEYRAVALGSGRDELLASLANPIAARAKDGKLAYLFTGQGSQRLGMGRELYESDPSFQHAFDRVCEQLDRHLEAPLKEIVFAKGEKAAALLEDTTYAQPALFAIEVALFEALGKRGLKPDLLAGHSIGEIAAAHISGVFDLPDASKLVAARGRLMGALPAGGAMAAIEAGEAEVAESITGKEAELAIAAINGPTATVISGAKEAVETIRAQWGEQGRKTKRLTVSHAFHSPLMEPMLEEFSDVAQTLTYSEPKITIVSNLSGELLDSEQATDPAYWVRHAREPVRFADAVLTLAQQGAGTYLELGPDPVLCAMARESLGGRGEQAAFVPTLRESRPESEAISTALAHAHAAGAKVGWQAFFAGTGAKRVPLPTYPFQRRRYWLDSTPAGGSDLPAVGQSSADHPLLGAAVELAAGEGGGLLLTGRLSLATHAWLSDHRVGGGVRLAGGAFVELALRAAEEVGAESIEELTVEAPLAIPERGAVAIQITVSGPREDRRREIAIHSRHDEEGGWLRNASGTLSAAPGAIPQPLGAWPPKAVQAVEIDRLYDRLAEAGLEYDPTFQGLTAAWRDGERIYAEVSLPEGSAKEASRFGIHPALLESVPHATFLTALEDGKPPSLPSVWRGVTLRAVGASELRVAIAPAEGGGVSLELADSYGNSVASVEAMTSRLLALEAAPVEAGGGRVQKIRRRRVTTASPASELAALPEAERGGRALDLVRAEVAAVLGHASAGEVDPERTFQELGFDSLAALELRNRLNATAGLDLSATAVLDHPTSAELGAHLLNAPSVGSVRDGRSASTFLWLIREADGEGRFAELIDLISRAAALRARFDAPLPAGELPKAVTLADGPETPSLILLPSVMPTSGPKELAHLARQFRGERPVLALSAPGFGEGEPLPGSASIAVQTQAEAILRLELASDFVLVGHSSGGWLAHGAASRLEKSGKAPAAVVLIDTFFPATGEAIQFKPEFMARMWSAQSLVPIDDARLTAMTAYVQSFSEWMPPEIETPIAAIRPSESHPDLELDRPDAWRGSWPAADAGIEVPGDHFSMIVTHAETTAEAIREAAGLKSPDKQTEKG
jgi:acyl transferase domain-containing protein/surfactin synthase thioesterase subunit